MNLVCRLKECATKFADSEKKAIALTVSFSPSPSSLPLLGKCFPLAIPLRVGVNHKNSTKVQNPQHKMQVALLAEPKTPLELSVSEH